MEELSQDRLSLIEDLCKAWITAKAESINSQRIDRAKAAGINEEDGNMEYKTKIVALIEKCNNVRMLEIIYVFCSKLID